MGKPKAVAKTNPANPLYAMYAKKLAVGKNDLSHADAKLMIPPTTSIWRANFIGAWMGHPYPHPRIQELWADHNNDSSQALKALVRRLWESYLHDKKLPLAACPIKDLFP